MDNLNLILNNFVNSLTSNFLAFHTFDMLLRFGLRFNEICYENWQIVDYQVYLHTRKNNNTRIFSIDEIPEYFIQAIDYQRHNYFFAYSTAYRFFERNIEYYFNSDKEHNLSLHIFRHNYCKELLKQGLSDEIVALKLGEKSVNSMYYYKNSIINCVKK